MVQQVPASGLSDNRPFKNLVINGGMKVAQRATSATTVVNGKYLVTRQRDNQKEIEIILYLLDK